jgi:hypothetical protein
MGFANVRGDPAAVRLPGDRTHFYSTGDRWADGLIEETDAPMTSRWQSPLKSYRSGQVSNERRVGGVFGPGFPAGTPEPIPWAFRDGDVLVLQRRCTSTTPAGQGEWSATLVLLHHHRTARCPSRHHQPSPSESCCSATAYRSLTSHFRVLPSKCRPIGPTTGWRSARFVAHRSHCPQSRRRPATGEAIRPGSYPNALTSTGSHTGRLQPVASAAISVLIRRGVRPRPSTPARRLPSRS